MGAGPTVWIVDDDPRMLDSLVWLLESGGHRVEACATPSELLEGYDPERPGCLLLDLQLPQMNGLELWKALRRLGGYHPFIVISGQGDVSLAVVATREGAVGFIEKPFDHRYLRQRIRFALQSDADGRRRRRENAEFQAHLNSLTPREKEVMALVAAGLLTKQIAKRLGISEKTVEVHRSHVTKKMCVKSVAQLVRRLTTHAVKNTDRR